MVGANIVLGGVGGWRLAGTLPFILVTGEAVMAVQWHLASPLTAFAQSSWPGPVGSVHSVQTKNLWAMPSSLHKEASNLPPDEKLN